LSRSAASARAQAAAAFPLGEHSKSEDGSAIASRHEAANASAVAFCSAAPAISRPFNPSKPTTMSAASVLIAR
jgi:hypothetical protein